MIKSHRWSVLLTILAVVSMGATGLVLVREGSKSEPADSHLVDRLLDFMEYELLPVTTESVSRGNAIYGGGMIKKSDLSTVVVGTNHVTENPLWHGEVYAINRYYELPPSQRVESSDVIFISSHEPCPLCLSAIAWAGYDNFYYLFSYEDSRDLFHNGRDLKILDEVFNQQQGEYNSENRFWKAHNIKELIERCDPQTKKSFRKRVAAITAAYEQLHATRRSLRKKL